MPWNLILYIWKKLDEGFPKYINNPENLHTLISYKTEKTFINYQ